MKEHWKRAVIKGVTVSSQKVHYASCANRWVKDALLRKWTSEARHDRSTLEYLDLRMKDLGKDGSDNQPLALCEELRGRKILLRQAPGES